MTDITVEEIAEVMEHARDMIENTPTIQSDAPFLEVAYISKALNRLKLLDVVADEVDLLKKFRYENKMQVRSRVIRRDLKRQKDQFGKEING